MKTLSRTTKQSILQTTWWAVVVLSLLALQTQSVDPIFADSGGPADCPNPISLSETDFTAWTSTTLAHSEAAPIAALFDNSGESVWRVEHTANHLSAFYTSSSFAYDPATQGSINEVSFSVAWECEFCWGLGQGWYPAVRQDGVVYVGSDTGWFFVTGSTATGAQTISSLTESQFGAFQEGSSFNYFGNFSQNPDFSASGSTIEFGFVTWQNGGIHITFYYDNVSWEICSPDSDGDGVPDSDDMCSGTVIPEFVPTAQLGVNRWALVDGDGLFDTTAPKGKGPKRSYTIADTRGCSCEQIIAAQDLGNGHTKFGCSISAMDAAVAGGAAQKPAVGAEATSWGEIKRQQQQE